MNILVTSAGGPAAIGVIKSLRHFDVEKKHKIIATDITDLSVGLELADESYIVPEASKDFFITSIARIIKDNEIDVILPTGNLEIDQFEILSKMTNVFMSDSKTIKLCNDKWKFYEKTKNDFDLPETITEKDSMSLPCVAKPRYELGGSRGVVINPDKHQYMSTLESDVEYIYQEVLPGQEYTIDILCDMDSKPLVTIPRKRLQTKAGISSKGEIISNKHIEQECEKMCRFLGLKGPVCIQMKEDDNGKPKFIEVNPRFGGGTFFTTLAGVNFVEIIISILENKKIVINEPKKIKVIRYMEEIVI
tara:strand:- start:332 stop:1246 length:915 start_codon:yes stop_codon:yes gene_type:complete